MAYKLPLFASSRCETLGAGTGTGTAVTASVSANTKGSYTTIGTTSFQYDGIIVEVCNFSSSVRFRVDIALNSGTTSIIVPDIFFEGNTAGVSSVCIPISVESGVILAMRCQASGASASFVATITGYQTDSRGVRGFSRCVNLTDYTNTDPTGSVTLSGTTQTAFATTPICASSAARIGAMYATLDFRGTAPTATQLLFDIGWGASLSERVFTRFLAQGSGGAHQFFHGPYPCDFPAGTRFSFRAQASTTNTNVVSVALFGLAL